MSLDLTALGVGIDSFNDSFGDFGNTYHDIISAITSILHFFGLA